MNNNYKVKKNKTPRLRLLLYQIIPQVSVSLVVLKTMQLYLFIYLFLSFVVAIPWAAPAAYGGSQGRG